MTDSAGARQPGWGERLWSWHAALLLGRNTVVSTLTFLLGLALLWLLVEFAAVDSRLATGVTFLFATTLHYTLGRTWIYRGTERGIVSGYGFFLFNAGVGLVLTVALFDALVYYTSIHYLVIRVIVSVVAGLAMFLLNAVLNFRRL